jgi:NIMA (never in mitosis gene a)-related kinase
MEYANHGDVYQKINYHKEIGTYLKERLIWKILIQSIMGLDTIHKLGVMHRDLKSANIFLKDPSAENDSKIEVSKNNKKTE